MVGNGSWARCGTPMSFLLQNAVFWFGACLGRDTCRGGEKDCGPCRETELTYTNTLTSHLFRLSLWLSFQTLDTFAPIGPAIVTPDEVGDIHDKGIRCRLNGETVQDSSTKQLVFNVNKIVEWCSAMVTLQPGDLIFTGTPPGVGCFRKPPLWLKVCSPPALLTITPVTLHSRSLAHACMCSGCVLAGW
jgi:hypothetical protein